MLKLYPTDDNILLRLGDLDARIKSIFSPISFKSKKAPTVYVDAPEVLTYYASVSAGAASSSNSISNSSFSPQFGHVVAPSSRIPSSTQIVS